MSRRLQAIGGLAALVLLVGAASASAQTAAAVKAGGSGGATTVKVALTPLFAPPGDPPAAQIAKAATNALTLMLRLTGAFTVIKAARLDPIMGYRQAVTYYGRVGAHLGMFGTVTPGSSGSYTITVQYWQATKPTAPPATFTRAVSSVASAVKAADELAVKVASAASDRQLSAGTVDVKNTAGLPRFSIFVDGHLAARNTPRLRLLAGKRTVTVEVPAQGGDRPVATFHVDVKPGRRLTVALTMPAAAKTAAKVSGAAPRPTTALRSATAGRRTRAGVLAVTSSPEGATVLLDGKRVGTTPLTLSRVSAGSHRLRIVHAYFLPVVKRVTLAAGKQRKLEATLTVNRRDPAVAARLRNPLGVGGSSLLWSAAQAARFFSLLAVSADTSGTTSSFLTSSKAFGSTGPGPATYLDIDFDMFLGRIGNRLAGNSTLTSIGDVWAATAAAAATTAFLELERGGSVQRQQTWQDVAAAAAAATVTGMVFDAGSSALGASGTDKRLLAYVSRHGELPPSRRPAALHPHRLILETGGDSLVRVGFRQPLVASYVAFEESIGLGTQSLASFAPRLVGGAVVSYNPWGAMTGSLRPELFVGVRASTDFSSTGTSVEPEFGTGNDWIGKSFDIFARGGLGYNLENGRWDQFFSIGTRIF